ncbi:MAG TPA: maleylacetoacetate isomerase [Azospirillaceae bacterium]|nr:maleylacetoacetate isomerase [Azospirillaceae bacterium]
MKLYGYFRSSAAFRVRIGLNLKGLAYEHAGVHLRKNEQRAAAYADLNPQMLVPALVDGEQVLTQSLAILEYLDETHPEPPFLPRDPAGRARVRAIAQIVACDVHPLNNLRVLRYLERDMGQDQARRDAWYAQWIVEGFAAIEATLAKGPTGAFCHGDTPTLADICLVPQVFNARRVPFDFAPYPTLMRVFEACMRLPAFDAAQPSRQPDAEP